MQRFAYDFYMALSKQANVTLIQWGGSNKYLPIVLPYFLLRSCLELLRHRVDVIYIQDGVLAPLGALLSWLFRTPYVLQIHGLDITFNNRLFQVINVAAARRAVAVLCVSQATADEAIKRGVDQGRIHILPLGVTDTMHADRTTMRRALHEQLALPTEAAILLTVGRLVKRKGVAWFVSAVMPQLVRRYPNLVYLIAGAGEQKDAIEQSIHAKRLEDHVRILGHVSDEQRAMLYNGADVFVQPNIVVPGDMEGFGLVLVEAALCGLPVVATGIEGIKDAIQNGQNGQLITKQKDAQAFILALRRFLDDQTYARQFGSSARTFTRAHYRWETLTKRYLAVFRDVSKQN